MILCYHRILPSEPSAAYFLPDLAVTPDSFRRQCEILQRYYEVLPLSQAVASLRIDPMRRRPLAAITFDDGYRDNHRYAAPILEEAGIKATFFVVVGLVGAGYPPWYDRMAAAVLALGHTKHTRKVLSGLGMARDIDDLSGSNALRRSASRVVAHAKLLEPEDRRELLVQLDAMRGPKEKFSPDDLIMDWRQVADLAERGHEIGSHSQTHEILPQLSDAALEAEVVGSRRLLEERLGVLVRSFCYPNGDVDDRVARSVARAGYALATTVESGHNEPTCDLFRLRRRFIHEDRLAGLRGTVSDTLVRMELCGLAGRVFGRRRGRASEL